MDRITADIVIAGGGVAGLTAAAAFGTAGFDVVIVDPTAPVTDAAAEGADLRTTAFLQPAQAFLDRAGLWDRLAPSATALQIMRIVDVSGAEDKSHTAADFDAADISDLPFGWNLPNWQLRRAMVARLAELPNVDFRPTVGFKSMLPREAENLVQLTDSTQVRCKLLIGADGRASAVRQAAEIGVTTTRYGQKALTFAVTHDATHDNVSTEIHRSGGPFTLVPLPDHDGKPCSSVVWMEEGANAKALAALPAREFEAAATERSAGIYGPLMLVSPRNLWPIISQLAESMSGPRTALVAEAAHVMPPIGAQGLNMSLSDLACLLDLAQAHRADPGARHVLDSYHKQRHSDARLRVNGVDALNRASMAGSPLLHDLRGLGIKALHGIAPLRKSLMQLGLGLQSNDR
jgi:2-octaprenyl-6-methoxyphenol hydroxylase